MMNNMQGPVQSTTAEEPPYRGNHNVLRFNMAEGLKRGLK